MKLLLYIFSVFISSVLAEDLCRKITTFNAVCQQGGITFLLSVSPCLSHENSNPLAFSIFNQKNQTFSSSKLLMHKEYYELESTKVSVQWDWKVDANSSHVFHQRYLNAKVFSVSHFTEMGNGSEKIIFEADFPFFNYMCPLDVYSRDFLPQNICNDTHKVGDYAYACFIKNSLVGRPQPKNGLYLLLFDSCTVPYSITVLIFFHEKEEIFMQSFTQDKTDTLLTLSQDGCGLHFHMNDHDVEVYNTTLNFVCINSTRITLIDGYFNTGLSKNCPLTKCTYATNLKHICQNTWILGNNQQVTAFMNVTLDRCSGLSQVFLNMYVTSSEIYGDQIFPFREDVVLRADHHHEMHDKGYAIPFHIGLPLFEQQISTNDGYLYLDGGNISLLVIEEPASLYVMILRHFPNSYDGIPLLYTEFQVKTKDGCLIQVTKLKNSGMKVGIAIAVVIFILLLSLLTLFVYWRKRSRQRGLGLPHRIVTEETADDL